MKQPEWQRGGICGALSSTSQQLNLEPSEEREREDDFKSWFKTGNPTEQNNLSNKLTIARIDQYVLPSVVY